MIDAHSVNIMFKTAENGIWLLQLNTIMSAIFVLHLLINTYRQAADLYMDGTTLYSQEVTTQGDPLGMPMYAIAILQL